MHIHLDKQEQHKRRYLPLCCLMFIDTTIVVEHVEKCSAGITYSYGRRAYLH